MVRAGVRSCQINPPTPPHLCVGFRVGSAGGAGVLAILSCHRQSSSRGRWIGRARGRGVAKNPTRFGVRVGVSSNCQWSQSAAVSHILLRFPTAERWAEMIRPYR